MEPYFRLGIAFSENLMECKMGKIRVVMKIAIYLGQAILDLSKIIMYKFHYNYMKPKYGKKRRLCYMDTDSLVYDIETGDFYEDIASNVKARFNMNGYSKDRALPIGVNIKVIGLMKKELGGRIMTEFVALRLKLYTYIMLRGSEDKRCKGVKECIMKKMPDFEDYKQYLLA